MAAHDKRVSHETMEHPNSTHIIIDITEERDIWSREKRELLILILIDFVWLTLFSSSTCNFEVVHVGKRTDRICQYITAYHHTQNSDLRQS